MARPNLLTCYQKMASLQEKMQHLQDRFGFANISGVINSAQIDLQQVPPSTLGLCSRPVGGATVMTLWWRLAALTSSCVCSS